MLKAIAAYRSSITLLLALFIGGMVGVYWPQLALNMQPVGQLFLNFLMTMIVPLVGFSVVASISQLKQLNQLGRLLTLVLLVSLFMATFASVTALLFFSFFDLTTGASVGFTQPIDAAHKPLDLVGMLSTTDFVGLFSTSHLLALIAVSILIGIAIVRAGEAGQPFAQWVASGNTVVQHVVRMMMKVAPLGLGAYFSATVAAQDSDILPWVAQAITLFFVLSLLYFMVGSTVFSYLAAGRLGVSRFWQQCMAPLATALGTCSSLATLPVTMMAANKMGIRRDVVDVAVPLLANFNKSGVALIVTLKIIFICGVLGMAMDAQMVLTTILLAVTAAIIVGGVPGGAFTGELFIVSSLGLPLEAMPLLVVIGVMTDAASTTLNAVQDLNAAQLIERLMPAAEAHIAADTPLSF